MMQKPRLVITASALQELQDRILAQYYNSSKHYKYNDVMAQYSSLVRGGNAENSGGEVLVPPAVEYQLAK